MISLKPPESYCYFKDLISGNFTSSEDEENCWEGYEGFDSFPVHYACKRDRFCNELDCIPNGNNPEKCYILFQKPASYKEASRICDQLGGNLPTIQSMEDFHHVNHHNNMNLWKSSWTSLQATFKNKYNIVDPCLGTLPAEMFGGSDFWLETRVIIKILTHS